MKMTVRLGMFLLAACGLILLAQQTAPLDPLAGVKTKAAIDGLVAKVRSGELKGAQNLFERDKGPYRVYTSFIDNRKGAADIHAVDDEIFLIASGAAEVTLGGDITDKKSTAENEFRGTIIKGGTATRVAVGDMISIPAGTAHQMNATGGQVVYLVIKFGARR